MATNLTLLMPPVPPVPPARPVGSGGHTRLGLPEGVRACLFDLDGVLTDTAALHAAAWKQMFDGYLTAPAAAAGTRFVAFDQVDDYDTYVDGRSRAYGIRSFLQSRGVSVPTGGRASGWTRSRSPVWARPRMRSSWTRSTVAGSPAYPGSVRYVKAVRSAGLRTAVVSSSANCAEVLDAAGIADLFETRIDGVDVEEGHLTGKPAPDTYLAAAKALRVEPGEAAVFEDALAGVAAGRAGGFGFVIGVDRAGQAERLRADGADRVVTDLAQLLDPVDEA